MNEVVAALEHFIFISHEIDMTEARREVCFFCFAPQLVNRAGAFE
jgi:hypothetical protein